jgi:hypothetical protein
MSRAGGRPSTTRSPIFSTFAETTAPLPTTATPAPRHSPPGPRSPARRWPCDRPAPWVAHALPNRQDQRVDGTRTAPLSVPIGYWPIRIFGADQMWVGHRIST